VLVALEPSSKLSLHLAHGFVLKVLRKWITLLSLVAVEVALVLPTNLLLVVVALVGLEQELGSQLLPERLIQ
jgi:hypothetical protein